MPGPHYQPDAKHPYAPAYVMSWLDVAKVAVAAGFSTDIAAPGGGGIPVFSPAAAAVAIAKAESGFDATIVNPSPGSCGPPNATGLWQICPGGRQYIDPRANASAALAKFNGAGHTWKAWNSGPVPALARPEVAQWLIVAQNNVEQVTGVNITHQGGGSSGVNPGPGLGQGTLPNPLTALGIPNPLHGIEAIGAFFAKLTAGATWLRILFVLGGLALMLWALYSLANQTKVGHAAIGKAKDAAKLAAVA